ncbi:hypothetical protein H4Q26_002077 [Puccinia striiformis f. sp. tritici PST-130]|nr:hypothetical protein H4Q26_002077 [Puccinia striiformis f. sp. tritici PST-130]
MFGISLMLIGWCLGTNLGDCGNSTSVTPFMKNQGTIEPPWKWTTTGKDGQESTGEEIEVNFKDQKMLNKFSNLMQKE